MATVVNNPQPSGDSGMGFFFGIIVLILFVVALWFWGIPALQRNTSGGNGVQIVPEQIDVNIKQEQPSN